MNFKMLRWCVASPPPSKKEQLAKNRKPYKCEWLIKDFCPLAWSVSQEAMEVYKKKIKLKVSLLLILAGSTSRPQCRW